MNRDWVFNLINEKIGSLVLIMDMVSSNAVGLCLVKISGIL